MSGSSLIDTSGSTPSIRIGALVSTLFGTVAYGFYAGWVRVINNWGTGVVETLAALAQWEGDLVGLLFSGLGAMISGAAQVTIDHLGIAGIGAQPVAFVMGMAVIGLVLWTVRTGIRRLRRSI